MSVGERILKARARKGWTQAELADRLGVGHGVVSRWESGESVPRRTRVELLASVLELSPEELEADRPQRMPRSRGGDRRFFRDEEGVVVSAFGDQLIPMCSYREAAKWITSNKPYPLTNKTDRVWANLDELTERSLALWVEDDSMMDEFYVNDLIVVDPDVEPHPGDYVLAKLDEDAKVVFRKYRPRGRDKGGVEIIELKPLNSDYPTIQIDANRRGRIIATMIEHRKYRRRRGGSKTPTTNRSRR